MPEAWESIDFEDFLNEPAPEYRWLIPNLLEYGDRVIVTGNEGMGKSTLLRQIAVQVACGISPFSLEPIEPRCVLFVDFENPRGLFRRKMQELADVQRPERGMLHVMHYPSGMDFTSPQDCLYMQDVLSSVRPDLVLGGPMYKMAPDLTTEEVSDKLRKQLDLWREQFGFALFLEAHQPQETIVQGDKRAERFRPMRPYGSSLWRRWPEFGICLLDGGKIAHWREDRDEREWPKRILRGMGEWPWTADVRKCIQCGKALPDDRDMYCDDKCGNAYRQAQWRRSQRG